MGRIFNPSGHDARADRRNPAVDAARLIFAFGVVVIHLGPIAGGGGAWLARFFLTTSVQFFFLVALYYFIGRVRSLEKVDRSALHFDRILVPYATWTLLYTLFRFAKCQALHTPFDLEIARVGLYGAGAIHLYFLPLLFVWQILALAVLLFFRQRQRPLALVAAGAAAAFAWFGKVRGYYCWGDALPMGGLYVALAFLLHAAQRTPQRRRLNVAIAALLAVGIVADTMGSPYRAWRGPFAAYSVATLVLHWHIAVSNRALRYAFGCSYAIYLAHLAFVELVKVGAASAGTPLMLRSALATAAVAALLCGVCIALAALARLHPIPRYLLLGERS